MLNCLTKIVDRIDTFQEDCAALTFGLKRLLGEDQMFENVDFITKRVEDSILVYKGTDLILTEAEEGIYVEPKYVGNMKLVKEAMKFLKTEDAESGPLGGQPGAVDGQQLGGMPVDKPAGDQLGGDKKQELRGKVEEFLKKFPNPQDNMVHGLAKKLGVSPDQIEEIFYQIASDSINSGSDEEPIEEDGGTKHWGQWEPEVGENVGIKTNESGQINIQGILQKIDSNNCQLKITYDKKNPQNVGKLLSFKTNDIEPLDSDEDVTNDLDEDGGTSGADIAVNPNAFVKKKTIKEGLVAGATLPAQDATAVISGGKAKLTKVGPSKANGLQKTITVVDTGE